MKLDETAILTRANEVYSDLKYANHLLQTDSHPEHRMTKEEFMAGFDGIRSDQIKSLLRALVEEINKQQNQLF